MNQQQKWYLITGLAFIILTALFPPAIQEYNNGIHVNREFLYFSEELENSHTVNMIYFKKLVTEWVFISALTALSVVVGGISPDTKKKQ